MELSERKKQILKSIIDAYIDSGEPVGSKYLTTYTDISLSSATIRNEMSELEEMGFLDKPHTSAGRVPSVRGYKFYVDQMSEDYRLTSGELELLDELTKFKTAQIDRLVDRVNKIMSGVTKYAAVSLAKSGGGVCAERFDTVYIDEKSFLLVMILSDGRVKTEQISSDYTLTEAAVVHIKELLSAKLSGVELSSVSLDKVMELEESFGKHRALVGKILRFAYSAVRGEARDEVRIDGVTNLLSYPEFNSAEKARSIVELVESRRQDIRKLMEEEEEGENLIFGDEKSGMKIFLGGNSADSALSDTSLVYCTFPVGGTNAVIGILGPRRMDYKRVVASLKYLADAMSDGKGNFLPGFPEDDDGEGI